VRLTKEYRSQIRVLIEDGTLDLDTEEALTDALDTIDALETELAALQSRIDAGLELALKLKESGYPSPAEYIIANEFLAALGAERKAGT
jgi:hypothetical protein